MNKLLFTLIALSFVSIPMSSSVDVYEDALYTCMDKLDVYEERSNRTWSGCSDSVLVFDIDAFGTGVSMKPLISENHRLWFCMPTRKDIHIGDIIAVGFGENLIVHEVIDIIDGKYQTQGYNEEKPDVILWDYEQVRGKLWLIQG